MRIQWTKRKDGDVVLRCQRPDGSVIWQRQTGRYASFFPLHDLTHYAIETTLALRQGFYGLIASGWTFSDFDKPWPRGRLPLDAAVAEFLVGCFDQERASGVPWTAKQLNESGAAYLAQGKRTEAWPVLTDEQLDRVRTTFRRVLARWHAAAAGQTLELSFDFTD